LSLAFEAHDQRHTWETTMAKGQKKSNREVRKPKTAKAKTAPAARSFLAAAEPGKPMASKRPGR
jgi:hypothetical protein